MGSGTTRSHPAPELVQLQTPTSRISRPTRTSVLGSLSISSSSQGTSSNEATLALVRVVGDVQQDTCTQDCFQKRQLLTPHAEGCCFRQFRRAHSTNMA